MIFTDMHPNSCLFTTSSTSRRFQQGEGPSRGLLQALRNFALAALIITSTNKKVEGAAEDCPAHGQEEEEGYCVCWGWGWGWLVVSPLLFPSRRKGN